MIHIKKIVIYCIGCIIAATLLFSGCVENQQQEGIQIVASFYPLAFFAEEIGGEYVNVRQLIPDNTELHAWQPNPSDIIAANNAEILVYNGADLDHWFEDNILTSIDNTNKIIVKTTDNINLLEPKKDEVTRLLIFDNDNKNTLVYDVDSHGNAALHKTFSGIAADVLPPFSGYFDTPPLLETHHGYWYLFAPRANSVEVINTGIHGDHFHDAELLLSIPSGKPVHAAISADGEWVAFAEDADKKTLVIPVSAPAQYQKYEGAGTSVDSHATVSFDKEGLLYSGDMRTPSGDNLVIIYPENGTIYRTGDAGMSPHGAVYSSVTGFNYFNCANGIASISKKGNEGNFSYTHNANNGFRLVRSWITKDHSSLVSYVRNLANGLEYDSLVIYDLLSGELLKEIEVNITLVNQQEYGYANSEFIASKSLVLFGDPENGQLHVIDIDSEEKIIIQLPGIFPQSMRITIDPVTEEAWVVSNDASLYKICLDDLEIDDTYQLESELGVNFVIAAITPRHSHEEDGHGHDHDHDLYDPHTWISPFIAQQQAQAIYHALVEKDPNNEAYYTTNWNQLKQKFIDADTAYSEQLATKQKDEIIVTHSAFGYLAERYGFYQRGVIGISADEQPSASTIATIINKMITNDIYIIYVDPVYSDDYAQTLKNTLESKIDREVQILTLYFMSGEINGLDYFQQMQINLENLKIGLLAS